MLPDCPEIFLDEEPEDLDVVAAAYHERRTAVSSSAREQIRDAFTRQCLPFAGRLARRYRGRGELLDDLEQVARLGLVKAIDRFDPERGSFTAYAVVTIQGEIKRHFRDRTWSVHVARRLQEMVLEVRNARVALTATLSRDPSVPEIAEFLDVPVTAVSEAVGSAAGHSPGSLNAPIAGADVAELGDLIGSADPDIASVDDQVTVRRLLRLLPAREQRMLALRFYGNKSQAEIAAELGVSQMHVSRLLSAALAWLRDAMLTDRPAPWRGTDSHRMDGVRLTTQWDGDAVTVVLRGEIDRDCAERARAGLHQAVIDGSHVTVDLSGVPLVDAAGIAVLFDAAQAAAVAGRGFAITGARPMVESVLTTSGLLSHLEQRTQHSRQPA